jgi:hypothetical protein
LVTKIPWPEVDVVVMWPALTTAPPTEALLIVMPVCVGALVPVAVSVPVLVLVTLPVTVEFWMLIQLMAPELVTDATEVPFSVIAHAARALGAPPPINSAATELETSNCRNVPD